MGLWTLLLAGAALAGPCPTDASTPDLIDAIQAADNAFIEMNLGAFQASRDRAAESLRCLGEALHTADAAAYHRLVALSAFVAEDHEGAVRSFWSSLAIQPNYVLSLRVAPEGHPLRDAYLEAGQRGPSAEAPLPLLREGALLVDGAHAAVRATARPVILQLLSADGAVTHTAWLAPDAPLPDWVPAQGFAALFTPAPPPPPAPRPGGRRVAGTVLLATTATTAVVAGTLYGFAWGSHNTFYDPNTPLEELAALRRRTNTAAVISGVTGGFSLGAGVGALMVMAF